jgi:hypothetical protein
MSEGRLPVLDLMVTLRSLPCADERGARASQTKLSAKFFLRQRDVTDLATYSGSSAITAGMTTKRPP